MVVKQHIRTAKNGAPGK